MDYIIVSVSMYLYAGPRALCCSYVLDGPAKWRNKK
ncbi:uncharacterized protein Dmoj_GI26424 [Drosophila mojavensis]|uniref:Uncharacterized protein n=1 Tax=Drosophila mojavensis TaxID=7230 RepID=A0A0Q9X9V8_DROMO|nr:uncharacterized protein Dmoj_GI26424 [Drosophila mojavensis]